MERLSDTYVRPVVCPNGSHGLIIPELLRLALLSERFDYLLPHGMKRKEI
jgi:hypothetical protein